MGSSVPTGGETTFKIEARGDDFKFQWRTDGTNLKNDSNYSGIDTDRLRIQQVKNSVAGYYRCLLRNEAKKYGVLTEEAHLSVCKFKFLHCVDTVRNYST